MGAPGSFLNIFLPAKQNVKKMQEHLVRAWPGLPPEVTPEPMVPHK